MSTVMKVLPMFYSDTATVEKARDFWELFEYHTDRLPDRERLLVFRQKLKGREAERWWSNSSIKSFATLKVRFHNRVLSRTADELWERLYSTQRERGESVEEWGDRATDLCDSLDYPNPQMRYQLFGRGLKTKRMLAALDSSPARDIPEACEWLMFKDMHRPVKEDDEFPDESRARTDSHTATVNALTQKLDDFLLQQQEWQHQVMEDLQSVPPAAVPTVSAVVPSSGGHGQLPPAGGAGPFGGNRARRGIKMAEDAHTQEGELVCGRCDYKGHTRVTCSRQTMTCRRCNQYGHIVAECEMPYTGVRGPPSGGNGGGNSTMRCFYCHQIGHSVSQCPEIATLKGLATTLKASTAEASSQ
ncbi:uncharacterized protein PITG_19792 [Phytophthora infestans T30-4]|uniref:CCHC-type domain-containing protein n=1 Tax=Phytophthora infestans (strain T30-4) TaxID=403677 RepID=D0P1W7_PHYIT|nr:uncharacterized protein PITG_19792 [Phytophthora infestans T30-4]EEY55102.1 conserved hypothetical protein [Phytophthora infestans T30-4]|eukprot:XP_002895707.1 conserved hypothetical protein [Phytophthora infestans T30-4]